MHLIIYKRPAPTDSVWEIYKKIRRCRTSICTTTANFALYFYRRPFSGFQDNGAVGWDCDKRVVVGFKFNRLRLSAQEVNG